MQSQSLTGVTLDGRYELGRMVGGGGMGHVYEAEHLGTGRRVAVKVISNAELAKDPHIVGRFQREANAAAAIDTPHICRVLDTGSDPESGAPFMVMELMKGDDVQQLLQRVGPLPPAVALRIGAQACRGLARAHEVDVVHRDVKPANLFLARGDGGEIVVKLLDFGIAKVKMERAHDIANAELTRTGMLLGSPLYMSPEQALGTKSIDRRADVWSLGIVLYQMLTGRTPYMHATALGELIMAICSEAPKPVQDLAPWVAPELATIVHRALRSSVDDRYQTADEMYEAIVACVSGEPKIDEAMLVGLTEEERQHVAARAAAPLPPARREASVLPYSPTVASVPPPGMGAPSTPPPVRPAMSSNAGVAHSMPPPSAVVSGPMSAVTPPPSSVVAPPSRMGFVVVGVLAGMALTGGGALYVMRGRTPSPVVATSVSTPPATIAPPPTAAAEPLQTAPAERTVKLVVIAADDAKIEVDGDEARAKGGIVEIKGALGSVHKVRVRAGKDETEEDVVVTEIGAQPPKVVLEKGVVKRAGPAASAKKPQHPGIEPKFE